MKKKDFFFELPTERIALFPSIPRDHARLLHIPQSGAFYDTHIHALGKILRKRDLLIFNDSRVIPARLYLLHKGKKISFTLLYEKKGIWHSFAKPARLVSIGDQLDFTDKEEAFSATLVGKDKNGALQLDFTDKGVAFYKKLDRYGHMPLPPYIKRDSLPADREDYQTVFAKKEGSIAAPTAGLHFTKELLRALEEIGFRQAYVTLHVGAGTFLPLREEDISKHVLHTEWGEVSAETVTAIKETQAAGGRIISVGTTTLRILESCFLAQEGSLAAFSGDTSLFITPGFSFNVIDALITNFHLPASSLFILVAAFSSLPRIQQAYAHAIEKHYRFYSYGDACFLERAS